jgi:small-conductance mechanosensitive channel
MIEIDGHKGQVKRIGFKSVELYYKKTYMVIPNVLFTTKPFINHTRNGYYAVFFDVKLLNKYDLDEKISQLENILDNSQLILKEPKYLIKIKNITTTGVDVTVKVYIENPQDDTKVVAELIKKIKRDMVIEDID